MAQVVFVKDGRGLAVVSFTQKPTNLFRAPLSHIEDIRGLGESLVYPIALDRTGVATGPYLNRRRPPGPADGHRRGLSQVRDNDPRSPVRVTFSGLPESERAELIQRGVAVTNCRD